MVRRRSAKPVTVVRFRYAPRFLKTPQSNLRGLSFCCYPKIDPTDLTAGFVASSRSNRLHCGFLLFDGAVLTSCLCISTAANFRMAGNVVPNAQCDAPTGHTSSSSQVHPFRAVPHHVRAFHRISFASQPGDLRWLDVKLPTFDIQSSHISNRTRKSTCFSNNFHPESAKSGKHQMPKNQKR